jgi:uncharacterized membrane protein YfcA
MSDLLTFIYIGAVFLLAGAVKGVIGLGLPTVAMGLLSLVMLPAEAASALILPSLFTNVWQLARGPHIGPLLLRLWPMLLGIVAGTIAAAGVITSDAAGGATMGLGAALLLYGVVGLVRSRLRLPAKAEPWAGPVVGVGTGLITGATGVFVVPVVPYLGSLGFNRDELVQALGLSFTVATLALAAALGAYGALSLGSTGTSLLALLPALAGMVLGGWLRTHISTQTFRICFFGGLIALGVQLLWQGLR